jgi:hypothetical protein
VRFDDFATTKPASVEASGGAKITGQMECGATHVTASGGADVTLTGKSEALTLKHSGGGTVKLGGFAVTDANVDVSGGSHSEVNVSRKISGAVSGGGQVKLMAQPASVEVRESGGGKISR